MVFRAPGGDKAQAMQGPPEGNLMTAQLGAQARLARAEDLRGGPRRRAGGGGASDSREPR
jgi:hypothetical protein